MPDLAAGAPVNSACACMLSSPYVSGTIVRFEPVKLPHAGLTALSRAVLPALCPLSSSQVERFSSRRSIEWQSAFVANIVSATVRSVRLSHLRDCYPFSIPHVMGYQEGPWTFRGRYYKVYSHICRMHRAVHNQSCYLQGPVPAQLGASGGGKITRHFVTAINCLDIPLRGARVRRQRSTFPATFR